MILNTLGAPANRMAFLLALLCLLGLLIPWLALLLWRGRPRPRAMACGCASLVLLALGIWRNEALDGCLLLAGALLAAALVIGKAPRWLAGFGWLAAAWMLFLPIESGVETAYRRSYPLPESTARGIAESALSRYASQRGRSAHAYRLVGLQADTGERMCTYRASGDDDEVCFIIDAFGNVEQEGGRAGNG